MNEIQVAAADVLKRLTLSGLTQEEILTVLNLVRVSVLSIPIKKATPL